MNSVSMSSFALYLIVLLLPHCIYIFKSCTSSRGVMCAYGSTISHAGTSQNTIDIYVSESRHMVRSFTNVSLGLEYDSSNGNQCNSHRTVDSLNNHMKYTPNRRIQRDTLVDSFNQNIQLGVVLALGGHNSIYYDYGPGGSINGLMAVWDTWVDNFFSQVSNTTSMILLFDERDFKHQNITTSTQSYLDKIVVDNMGATPSDCVYIRDHIHPLHALHNKRKVVPHGCTSNFLDIDDGYKVYYIDISKLSTNRTSSSVDIEHQQPIIIFAGIKKFPKPTWAVNEDEEHLFTHFRPFKMGKFQTNYGYVKMTNWYAYHMLNLKLLDYFDYAGKLDNDVSFVAPFPDSNLPKRLIDSNSMMLATQDGWYYDSPRVSQGIELCLYKYIENESKACTSNNNKNNKIQLIPSGINATLFWEGNFNLTFRSHFLVFWLGIYAAPEVRNLAHFWNEWHPHGMWDYRWGDQQWWPRPLAMYGSGNLSAEINHYDTINTDNGKYVVHKVYPLSATVPIVSYFNMSGSTKKHRQHLYAEASKRFIY